MENLKNISPIDGRYKHSCKEIAEYFSEYALIKYRIYAEIQWLVFLNEKGFFFKQLSVQAIDELQKIANINDEDALRLKQIEKETNHDVKAVEYFIKEKISQNNGELVNIKEYVHYLCTSEDINNIAYGICIKSCLNNIIIPHIEQIMNRLKELASEYSHVAILSRTHGQPASATTFGKEMANYFDRLKRHVSTLKNIKIYGKFNGAVGNFNAHKIANNNIDWVNNIKYFVEKYFHINYSLYCTQIQDHDYICEISDALGRINSTLLDLSIDIWLYISNNLLKLKHIKNEIGSSTMPHKINPIDFENAEGNLHLANALFKAFSAKLPISRLQRDLSDSTVLRNIGTSYAYSLISYKSILKGLGKIDINEKAAYQELNNNWSTLAEPVQIVLKNYNFPNAYEELKNFTRGKTIDKELMQQYIKTKSQFIPPNSMNQLLDLSPNTYIGYADYLASNVDKI
ncbi:adenylosuccinate lyase, putative [Plasmodium berghei]|uniref:Adenylosuccinate lyase n=4 Tax=Plasmodium TaxID=5820 RepID=A0A509AK02_PLABA|nr:adenylosuccinate lyase, putative [Plasmodium berghei ANKA]AAL60070.1 adenylosuccinate lyase [Plasmodium berghei]CXH92979.1 adenylosuccinate lyase, putative [Plasmodium berghei]SCL90739.1 adenylosuccinate lyase, putative [Plasmodium berghei]SCM15343.1 adenylosuccinate lyase, putative [Plasmodium berghei]SCM17136.1 adenylosuccinate lyase, putative [Plasmodium berghei]|eukprot:XP_034419927.1 adenylosuccinate lyase, putative [Plasmodium berghei ANKA]